MPKLPLILAAATLAGLASCTPPPPPPPPRFQPNPPYPPVPVDPYGSQNNSSTQPPTDPPVNPPPAPGPTIGGYPTATRTANPDQVLSPYEPFNVIDVAGFKSGQLARDPSNQKIFRVP